MFPSVWFVRLDVYRKKIAAQAQMMSGSMDFILLVGFGALEAGKRAAREERRPSRSGPR